MRQSERDLVLYCLREYKAAAARVKGDEILQIGWSQRYKLVQRRNKLAKRYLTVLGAVWEE